MKNDRVFHVAIRPDFLCWVSFWIVFTLFTSNVFAQQGELPQQRYRGKLSWSQAVREANKVTGGFSMSYGYHQSTFMNQRFAQVVGDGFLKPAYGDYFQVRYTAVPVILEANWFSSRFKVADNYSPWPYADTVKVKHRGWEFALSYIPVQQGVLSKYVVPYVGISYQIAFACASCGWEEDIEKRTSVDTSMPVWKVGALINFSPFIGIDASYKQSLQLSREVAFYQVAAGIIWRFNHYAF